MREVLRNMLTALELGRPAAYCQLVDTQGSTPQKVGALMLCYQDGTQSGRIGGGGHVAVEIQRRALTVLRERRRELATFSLSPADDRDEEPGRDRSMTVLIDAVAASPATEYYRSLAARAVGREGATHVVQLSTGASTNPAMFLIDANGRVVASLDAAALPPVLCTGLKPLVERPVPYTKNGFAYLPIVPRCPLLIVGSGQVGRAVAELAVQLDFAVSLYKDRADDGSTACSVAMEQTLTGELELALRQTEITSQTYVLVLTRNLSRDRQAMRSLIDRGAGYLGMIGNRAKIRSVFNSLRAEGVSRDAIQKVYAPVGIDIGSQTTMEIAVSIAAELVAHRSRGVVPGRVESLPRDRDR